MQTTHYITDFGKSTVIDAVQSSPTAAIPRFTVWCLSKGAERYTPCDSGNDIQELASRYNIDISHYGTQVLHFAPATRQQRP